MSSGLKPQPADMKRLDHSPGADPGQGSGGEEMLSFKLPFVLENDSTPL